MHTKFRLWVGIRTDLVCVYINEDWTLNVCA